MNTTSIAVTNSDALSITEEVYNSLEYAGIEHRLAAALAKDYALKIEGKLQEAIDAEDSYPDGIHVEVPADGQILFRLTGVSYPVSDALMDNLRADYAAARKSVLFWQGVTRLSAEEAESFYREVEEFFDVWPRAEDDCE